MILLCDCNIYRFNVALVYTARDAGTVEVNGTGTALFARNNPDRNSSVSIYSVHTSRWICCDHPWTITELDEDVPEGLDEVSSVFCF